MKICNKCGIEKDENEFYFRNDQNKLRKECKECCGIRSRNDYAKNAERNREYANVYREAHKEQNALSNKKWREENKEYIKQKDKEKYLKNKTKRNKQSKDNGEKVRNYTKDIKENNPCVICGNYFPACAMDFDHIDPKNKEYNVCKSGSILQAQNEIKKCQLMCANCHRIKSFGNRPYIRPLRQFADGYKINMCCVDCNLSFNPVAMDFDHINPMDKISGVSTMIKNNKSKQIIYEEILKCEIRCACCHRIKTFLKKDT